MTRLAGGSPTGSEPSNWTIAAMALVGLPFAVASWFTPVPFQRIPLGIATVLIAPAAMALAIVAMGLTVLYLWRAVEAVGGLLEAAWERGCSR